MRPPWRRLTLRTRLMVIGLLGLALAQAIGSFALYTALSVASLRGLDDDAAAAADEVADLVTAGRLPTTLPVAGTEIVQVVDSRGRVVSASLDADRLTPMLRGDERTEALSGPVTVPGSRLGISSRLRVTALRAGPPGDRDTVLVAEPVDELTRSEGTLLGILLVSYPILLALLGLVAWRVIGAALGPVEELRSAADRISGSGLDVRLPLPASDDEIRALAVTLNSMLERLAAARDRERDLVADVAHELRSPLASMRLQTDVALRLGEGGEVVDGLDAEVTRMSALVDDLLVLARLDADGAAGAEAEPVAVAPALDDVATAYADGPAVTVDPAADRDAVASTRRDELDRVLGNLVANARRHARSEVRLTVLRRADRVLVRVDDDGPGIPPEERERVLERFVRLDDARDRDAGGAGLGLAIVRELLRSRGGDVRLTESPAGGLRAEVELPGTENG